MFYNCKSIPAINKGVQGPTFGQHVEMSKNVKNNIGNHPQALISHFGPIINHKNQQLTKQMPKIPKT